MAENELKPKSFRINDETAERIKEITSEIGGNQQEALAKMIEAYEFQKGKAILVERKADIENFENHMSILVRMFMGVLEDNQNNRETIRAEFAAQLNMKDITIQDLQEKCSAISAKHDTAVLQLEKVEGNHAVVNEQLYKTREELRTKETQYNSMLVDKENLNKILTNSIEELKDKITKMTDEILDAREIATEFENTKKQFASAIQEIAALKKQLEETKTESERSMAQTIQVKEIELEKKILEIQKGHQYNTQKLEQEKREAIDRLEQEKRSAIDRYQTKYLSLLEQIEKQGFKTGEPTDGNLA